MVPSGVTFGVIVNALAGFLMHYCYELVCYALFNAFCPVSISVYVLLCEFGGADPLIRSGMLYKVRNMMFMKLSPMLVAVVYYRADLMVTSAGTTCALGMHLGHEMAAMANNYYFAVLPFSEYHALHVLRLFGPG